MGRPGGRSFFYQGMKERISRTDLANMFAQAAQQIREHHEILSRLDSVAGDGDHGTTMLRVAEQLETAIEPAGAQSPRELLKSAGWKVLGIDGGASSALLGTFFSGMGDAEVSGELDCEALSSAFEAGLRALSRQTKAAPGDKTMMDALVPAVNAFHAAASSGKNISCAFEEAALAANSGAESTRALVARYGRAKFLGDQTRGHPDAGATSVALLFSGFSAAFTPERKN
jgi:phosphoenolpyruvate---glycerone phosphotransferase subunit DhaL